MKHAGRVFKHNGKDEAIKLLDGKGTPKEEFKDFHPPAKCLVVAKSRPFEEWPIYKASSATQASIYALPKQSLPDADKLTSKASHERFLADYNIDTFGYRNVQGLNLILKHAINIYKGVEIKVENRNEKQRKKHFSHNGDEFVPDKAFDDAGFLLQPPGINQSIYCYACVSPEPFDISCPGIIILPNEYAGCNRGISQPIAIGGLDRLSIPQGQPGYIPEWQRPLVKKRGRIRRRRPGKAVGAILGKIVIGDDWCLFDMRGLLRNALWRKIVLPHNKITSADLLKLFTGDPVIDVKRNIISFIYKQAVLHKERAVRGKRSKDLLLKLCAKEPVALVSMDLGQTNPAAVRISRILQQNSQLEAMHINSSFLQKSELQKIASYRDECDRLEHRISEQAILLLPDEQQKEIRKHQNISADETKLELCRMTGIVMAAIPWEDMSRLSCFIADHIIANHQDNSLALFETTRKGKKQKLKSSDGYFSRQYRFKLPQETRKMLNETIWDLKKQSVDYERLAQRKKELVRSVINRIANDARKASQCRTIVFNIEDLNMKGSFFDGAGKQESGWNGFFTPKKENRWFVKAFHKAISELPTNQGLNVIESNAARTSITCVVCDHCDPSNRDGELFVCTKCGDRRNTDLEVATINLERVAMSGAPMPRMPELRVPSRRAKGGVRSQGIEVSNIISQMAGKDGLETVLKDVV